MTGVPSADPNQAAHSGAAHTGAVPAGIVSRWRAAAARRPVLDWITAGLLVLGLIFVATGLLPHHEASATIQRILPLLLFLGSVIVLAELTADAGVFDVIAVRVAGLARGNYVALFVLCVFFAAATTTVLNLDTTAVLLMPVSNLTNLLAANRVGLPPAEFAARMWPVQLVSIAVTMVFLWAFFWRRGKRGAARYDPPLPLRPDDPVL